MSGIETEFANGLSPRVRGNLPGPAAVNGGQRSIPACAGEPGLRPIKSRHTLVYPRVCGGTCIVIALETPLLGLSPRVRGNLCPGAGCIAG